MGVGTRKEATIDDLYRVEGKAEVVDGEIVHMSPTGSYPGYAGGLIFASLLEHSQRTKDGKPLPDNVAYVVKLPRRKSFSPDVSYFYGPLTMRFVDGAPAFAVEVRSEGDSGPAAERAMAAKRADYFAAGTLVVWDVDLEGPDVVRKFTPDAPGSPTIFRRGEVADAEPAVPGWRMEVEAIFG